jgi:hypothetical protein
MVQRNWLYVFGILLLFTACEQTDNNLEVTSDTLAGEWQMSGFTYGGRSTNEADGAIYQSNFAGTGRDVNFTIWFNADGTYTSTGSYTIDVTYAFGGQEFTQPLTMGDQLESGTYLWEDNQLSMTRSSDGLTQVATNLELSTELLVFELQHIQTNTGQGTSSTLIIDGDFQLRRQ